MTEQKKSFLARAIERSGKTQEEVAWEVGVSPQSVSKWVNGTAKPRPANVPKLCKALGITRQEYDNECFREEFEIKGIVIAETEIIIPEETNEVEIRFYTSLVGKNYVSMNQILNVDNDNKYYKIKVIDEEGEHFVGVYNGSIINITTNILNDSWTKVAIGLAQLMVKRNATIISNDVKTKYIIGRLAFEIAENREPYNGEDFFNHYESIIKLNLIDKLKIRWKTIWNPKE